MARAQASIFIIAGIIIMFVLILITLSQKTFTPDNTGADTGQIRAYIESCIRSTTAQGLQYIALQGGYYYPAKHTTEYAYIPVPYYWYNNTNLMPSIDEVQTQLSYYITHNINLCLNNLSVFQEKGYEIHTQYPQAEATFSGSHIIVDLSYPTEISYNDISSSLDSFSATIDYDFLTPYHHAHQILVEQEKYPNYVPFSYLTSLAYNNSIQFELMYADNTVLYSLIYPFIYNESLVYTFASMYNWTLVSHVDYLSIQPIPPIETEGGIISHTVLANRPNVTFSDDTSYFNITSGGLIQFNSSLLPLGRHIFIISAETDDGDYAFTVMQVDRK